MSRPRGGIILPKASRPRSPVSPCIEPSEYQLAIEAWMPSPGPFSQSDRVPQTLIASRAVGLPLSLAHLSLFQAPILLHPYS